MTLEHGREHGDDPLAQPDERGDEQQDDPQGADAQGADLQDEVQASGGSTERLNRHLQRSHSEQARYLSAYFGWSLHGDAIRSHGSVVSEFVEDLADTMLALRWMDGTGILWDAVPVHADEAVALVRRHQLDQGWIAPGTP